MYSLYLATYLVICLSVGIYYLWWGKVVFSLMIVLLIATKQTLCCWYCWLMPLLPYHISDSLDIIIDIRWIRVLFKGHRHISTVYYFLLAPTLWFTTLAYIDGFLNRIMTCTRSQWFPMIKFALRSHCCILLMYKCVYW